MLNQRQCEILTQNNLPTEYDELTILQKSAITAIDKMLSYIENKYNEEFILISYNDGRDCNPEQITAYPSAMSSKDIVTVKRFYSVDHYVYEDDYLNLKLLPEYTDEIEKVIEQYFEKDSFKVFPQITKCLSEDADISTLKRCAATNRVFIDCSNISSEKFIDSVNNFSDYLSEFINGTASCIIFYLVNQSDFSSVNKYNSVRKIFSIQFIQKKIVNISSDGRTVIY